MDCKHKHLEYHECCDSITCKDCGKKWEGKVFVYNYFPHYISTSPIIPYTTICSSTSGIYAV